MDGVGSGWVGLGRRLGRGRERYGIIWYELKVTDLVRVGGK